MGSRPERIGLAHLTAPVAALRALHCDAEADQLQHAAVAWCAALLAHRRSPAYRIVLRDPSAVPVDALFTALTVAADTLRLHGDLVGLGAWASALAARLVASLENCDPLTGRLLACISTAADGTGELVFFPHEPDDSLRIPGLELEDLARAEG